MDGGEKRLFNPFDPGLLSPLCLFSACKRDGKELSRVGNTDAGRKATTPPDRQMKRRTRKTQRTPLKDESMTALPLL
jgi:hypothetical protein